MMSIARRWYTRLAPLLLAAVLLAGVFVFAATRTRKPAAFGSDDLYCLSVCEDLLQGRDLRGWHFTAVPLVFPDLTLLLPCQALSSNLVVVFLAYNVLFYGSLAAALAWVVCLVGLGRREAFLTACTGVLFLLVAHLDPSYDARAGEMYQPGYHIGAILSGVLLMGLVLHGLRLGVCARTGAALLALGGLAVFSDRLLIVEFLAPLLGGLSLLAVTRAAPLNRLLALGALLGTGIPLASGMHWCAQRLGLILMQNNGTIIARPHWEEMAPFCRRLLDCTKHQHLLHALLPLYLLAGLAVVCCWLRERRDDAEARSGTADNLDRAAVLFVAGVATAAPLCDVAAVFLCSRHNVQPRYLFACWLLPFLFVGLFVQLLPAWLRKWGGASSRLAIVVFALYRLGVHGAGMDCTHFEPPYPALAQALDRLQRERGPMRGLAGYWVARRMDFLSRERVWVRPVGQDGSPFFHAYNPNRFLDDDPAKLALPCYNFIIVSPAEKTAPSPERVRDEFGEPAEKIAVGGDEVWLYKRLSSPRFDRFLEAQLALRMCRHEKYVAPVWPAALAQPKPNLLRWWAAGNVQPKQGEDVEVRFDHPIRGGLIDVAANYRDEYRLAFYRGEQLQGTLDVPAVPWTGAVFYFYSAPAFSRAFSQCLIRCTDERGTASSSIPPGHPRSAAWDISSSSRRTAPGSSCAPPLHNPENHG